MKTISIINPPYQPEDGVKRGGNEYKLHVLQELKRSPILGVANIPMTFMVQDPFDRDNIDFRNTLLKAGLKKIKHVIPNAYKASVLTVYLVWQEGYTGDVEFVTYDVNDVNKWHSLSVPRDRLLNARLWPVARTQHEFDLATSIINLASEKTSNLIQSNPSKKRSWCVEWEYLIGMEKERLNRVNPVRKIEKRGPNDTVRGGSLSRFFNVNSEQEADELVTYLNTVGQEWQRTIPRGSSVENWMMAPVILRWLNDQNREIVLYE